MERDTSELGLRSALGVSLVATRGYGSAEAEATYVRCRQLCQVLGRPPSPPILRALAMAALAQARIDDCHALGDHLLSVAEREDDPVLRAEANFVISVALLLYGVARPAQAALEASLAAYDRSRSAIHISLYSQDPARRVPDPARPPPVDHGRRGRLRPEAGREPPARGGARPSLHARLRANLGRHHRVSPGDAAAALTAAEAAMALGRDHRMPFWLSIATVIRGWAVAEAGEIEAGIEEIRAGIADFAATGSSFMRPFQLGLLAEQHGRNGNPMRGITLIAEALAASERTNERWCEPELYRRQGDLHLLASDDAAAEAAYRRAVDIARYQGAGALERRSAARLAELLVRQGRPAETA